MVIQMYASSANGLELCRLLKKAHKKAHATAVQAPTVNVKLVVSG